MIKSQPHVVITGFMGCGKTRVARLLAQLLNQPLVDLDEAITSREGRSPARLIVEDGEVSFRKIETELLREVLENSSPAVVALGGGAWIQEPNRKLIHQKNAITVWLDTPFDICWQRIVTSEEDRPLGRTVTQARELFDRRRPIYQLAQIRIKVNNADRVASLAKRIRAEIHKGGNAA